MKMTFRWFGEKDDTVTLAQIRQIPGITGVVGALFDIPVGDVWPMEDILSLKSKVNHVGLEMEIIESVNIHEDIKLGAPQRDAYIENYKQCIRNLSKAGVKVICYNFMPVYDWLRSELAQPLPDGSKTMMYDNAMVKDITPDRLV
ncbi:MAG: mannonate dehydratase, partial [Oscillospiraceae bacterium]|nr:mannonate dehydratase [Oscillospiraceae bacterium]